MVSALERLQQAVPNKDKQNYIKTGTNEVRLLDTVSIHLNLGAFDYGTPPLRICRHKLTCLLGVHKCYGCT